MHVLIPAGGRGSRLRPLTNYYPKPLLPLGDRPILSRLLDYIPREFPVTVLVTPDLRLEFQEWRDRLPADRDVSIYVERTRTDGLAGPVVALAECVRDKGIRGDVATFMGDSIPPFTLAEFIQDASERPRVAVYQVPSLADARRFGVVEIGRGRMVKSFQEKPAEPRSRWAFTGCLYLPGALLPELQGIAAACPPQMGQLVNGYLDARHNVEVFRARGEWHDIGTVTSFLQAHYRLLSQVQRKKLMSAGNQLSGVVYVHPSARVEGSVLNNCVVFAGAEITGARLEGCIVSTSATVRERIIEGKLVTRETELQLGPESEVRN